MKPPPRIPLRHIKTLPEVNDYEFETATTGEEGLEKVDEGLEPDLVWLDVLMPGIDALETVERLRHKQPATKTTECQSSQLGEGQCVRY